MLLPLFSFITAASAIVVAGPNGPWSVSYEVVQLTDETRWDPHAPVDSPHKRRILTSIFTPIGNDCDLERVDYLPPKTLEVYGQYATALGVPASLLEGFELEVCRPNGQKQQQQQYPVAISSPGIAGTRLLSNAQAQSLASRGNIVITVDHPYDANIVEFPDGTAVYGLYKNTSAITAEDAANAVPVSTYVFRLAPLASDVLDC